MVTFASGDIQFNYRAGAVVLREDHVLLTRQLGNNFWFLPGGRVELGESASEALAREVREELGVEGEIERLLWINENFFQLRRVSYHEIGLYFLVSLPAEAHRDLSAKFYCEESDGSRFELAWFRRDRLEDVVLVPGFLVENLSRIPPTVQHVVQRDS
jgi:ADP-ribose pyrophosphatase YjhB (NUDIX family)